ncbi:hypothetical protein M426DRAFT_83852 [Hypoxylon sp. CI-4A]|nr:hypothetical protein M426DRAFT_83852 [Hypoxylon sp. CI-4A]
MPAARIPLPYSLPDLDPQNIRSRPGNCGLTVKTYAPSSFDSTTDSLLTKSISSTPVSARPSLKSTGSIDDLPAIGAYPLGSLRVTDPTEDSDVDTPLTVPDAMDESPLKSENVFPTGGDVLILDDLPASFTVGCDTMSFSTKKSFPGFRDIPPGAHLIWVAPSELTSTRSAYWIFTPERKESEPAEVYVKQWDRFNELLSDPATQAEERFQKQRLHQFYDSLSPYQLRAAASGVLSIPFTPETEQLPSFLSNLNIWNQLTSAINPNLLNRITGTKQKTWQVTTLDRIAGEISLAEEARLYASGRSQLRFTFPMDAPLINATATGMERTQQALDPTTFVLSVLEEPGSGRQLDDLVGELSFAFLTGMHLGNYSCLEQWWFYTTKLIFRCYGLATSRPQLALNLIRTFHAQLVYNDRHLEGDIMDTSPGSVSRLQKALVTYKVRLDEALLHLGDGITPDQHEVGTAFAALESWLWRRGWDLRGQYVRSGSYMLEDGEMVEAELSDFEDEDERGEFAPVVVELDRSGNEAGLVSWNR